MKTDIKSKDEGRRDRKGKDTKGIHAQIFRVQRKRIDQKEEGKRVHETYYHERGLRKFQPHSLTARAH